MRTAIGQANFFAAASMFEKKPILPIKVDKFATLDFLILTIHNNIRHRTVILPNKIRENFVLEKCHSLQLGLSETWYFGFNSYQKLRTDRKQAFGTNVEKRFELLRRWLILSRIFIIPFNL